MKRFLTILFLLLLLVSFASAMDKKDFDKYFKLLPQPQKVELNAGKGNAYQFIQSIFLKGTRRPVLPIILESLPLAVREGIGVLVLQVSKDKDLPAPDEGYILEIKPGQVLIRARSEAGLFYGCQTLGQLLEDGRDQKIGIPLLRITDEPDIRYRAVHLDLKHHLITGNYFYDIIDKLAAIKINAIIIEFEDKLRYRKAALVGAPNAISVEEFAAISGYAKSRNIEISPLVQGLGHASFILKHEKYKALRDDSTSDWAFDPLNPATYDLQFSLYEDAVAATPYGKYLHVGGDEVGNLGQSELAKKSGLKPIELQMTWLKKVCEFAKQHNRIPIFWDDMVFKLAGLYQSTWDAEMPADKVNKLWVENSHQLDENINLFPKECVYMRWNYDAPAIPGNFKAIDWYKAHNLKVMAATAAQTMWPMLPRANSNFQPIKQFCKIAAEKNMEGILCTAWDDCSPHLEGLWRGFYDFAFFSWNYADASKENVHTIFRHRFWAPQLSDSSSEFQDQLEQALEFWETALIDKGDRNNYHKDVQLIDLPNPNNSGAWSKKYSVKVQEANQELNRYNLIRLRIQKAMQQAKRNRYALEVINVMNEMQVYSAKIVLLMDKYDNSKSAMAKNAAKESLKNMVNRFADLRKTFEDVYSQTRVLSNAEGYLLDQNHHEHLANGTNNSDWMYVYELAMNDKIKKWFSQ